MPLPTHLRTASTDPGPARIRMAAICAAIAASVLIAGIVWLGAPAVLDPAAPDFFPLPAGFALVFAAFGLLHLACGLRDLARRRKTGLSRLETGAARLGKPFAGRIHTAQDVAATGPYRIRLACEHHTVPADTQDEGSRRQIVVLWQTSATAPAATRSDAGIPFAFAIPADGLASDAPGLANGDFIVWRLTIAAPTAGLDYAAEFIVEMAPETGGEAPPRPVAAAFQGLARPERPAMRFLRFALPIAGTLMIAGGGYASANQFLHGWHGTALGGTILSFTRPRAEIALDGGGTVSVTGLSSHTQFQPGQRVTVTCRVEDGAYAGCRMDTGADRWIDPLATLAIGLVLAAVGAALWLRRRPAMDGG